MNAEEKNRYMKARRKGCRLYWSKKRKGEYIDEIVEATGYDRKVVIRMLKQTESPPCKPGVPMKFDKNGNLHHVGRRPQVSDVEIIALSTWQSVKRCVHSHSDLVAQLAVHFDVDLAGVLHEVIRVELGPRLLAGLPVWQIGETRPQVAVELLRVVTGSRVAGLPFAGFAQLHPTVFSYDNAAPLLVSRYGNS